MAHLADEEGRQREDLRYDGDAVRRTDDVASSPGEPSSDGEAARRRRWRGAPAWICPWRRWRGDGDGAVGDGAVVGSDGGGRRRAETTRCWARRAAPRAGAGGAAGASKRKWEACISRGLGLQFGGPCKMGAQIRPPLELGFSPKLLKNRMGACLGTWSGVAVRTLDHDGFPARLISFAQILPTHPHHVCCIHHLHADARLTRTNPGPDDTTCNATNRSISRL